MKYNIQIMSRYETILFDTKDLTEDYIIISINSTKGETHHKFKNNRIKNVIYLDFDDITNEQYNKYNLTDSKLMELSQAKQINEFIDTYKDIVKNIVVHCSAGISRSGAVGCVLARYLNGDDLYLFQKGTISPNQYVSKLMCEAFNLEYNQEDFDRKLRISAKKCVENLKGYGDFGIDLNDMFGGESR